MTIHHMKPVKSSSVSAVGYDPITKTLAVTFVHGKKRYEYQDVQQDVVDALHKAESVGKFIAANVVGKYPHQAHETA
jgi:hypothetical protein